MSLVLYWAMARNDAETNLALQKSPGMWKLLGVAPVLDFYGSQISIRQGRVLLPGGTAAEGPWKELVGVSPTFQAISFCNCWRKITDGWRRTSMRSLASSRTPAGPPDGAGPHEAGVRSLPLS